MAFILAAPFGARWYWSIYVIGFRGPIPEGMLLRGLADDLTGAKAAKSRGSQAAIARPRRKHIFESQTDEGSAAWSRHRCAVKWNLGFRSKEETTMKIGHYAVTTATVLALSIVAASADLLPERVSGYEYFIGIPCTIDGGPATCDVQFAGWTGSAGQVANGWRPFPGNGLGMWTAIIDYKGKPKFGGQVTLLDGNFDLMYSDGQAVLGRVTGGTITWPAAGQSTICGMEVAVVSVNVRYRAGATGRGVFQGCLHDLPFGSVLPPKIWGRLK